MDEMAQQRGISGRIFNKKPIILFLAVMCLSSLVQNMEESLITLQNFGTLTRIQPLRVVFLMRTACDTSLL